MDSPQTAQSLALAAFSEDLITGRRVVVFGNALSGLAETLVERGARLIHVYDENPARVAEAAARSTSSSVSFAPLAPGGIAARDGAFDVGFVEEVAAFSDTAQLVMRLRRALGARGIGFVCTANPDVSPLWQTDKVAPPAGPLSYYELYDLVSTQFDEVRMVGQTPFAGYALADFSPDTESEFSIDTGFVPGGAEEPERYVAVCSHFPIAIEPFCVVQMEAAALIGRNDNKAPVGALATPTETKPTEIKPAEIKPAETVNQAQLTELRQELTSERSAKTKLEQLLRDVNDELKRRDEWVTELESRATTADERADTAEAELERLSAKQQRARAEEARPAREPDRANELRERDRKLEEATRKLAHNDQQLEAQAHQLKGQAQQLEAQTRKLEAQAQKLDAQTQKLDAQTQKLDAQTQKLDAQAHQLDAQTQKLTAQAHQLDSQTQTLTDRTRQLAASSQLLTHLEPRLAELERQLELAEQAKSKAEAAQDEARGKLATFDQDLASSTAAEHQLAELQANQTELQTTVTELQTTVTELRAQVSAARSDLQLAGEEIFRAEQQLVDQGATVRQLRSDLADTERFAALLLAQRSDEVDVITSVAAPFEADIASEITVQVQHVAPHGAVSQSVAPTLVIDSESFEDIPSLASNSLSERAAAETGPKSTPGDETRALADARAREAELQTALQATRWTVEELESKLAQKSNDQELLERLYRAEHQLQRQATLIAQYEHGLRSTPAAD